MTRSMVIDAAAMLAPAPLCFKTVDSPVGELTLVASGQSLCMLLFPNAHSQAGMRGGAWLRDDAHPVLCRAQQQLGEYFSGRRKQFDLPLKPQGTVFQIKAWRELQKIPYGQTISYGEQARAMGDAKKARAVGMANGRNPLPVIVPCHRVIGASGDLTGFGGGLKVKEFLLSHERRFSN